MATRDGEMHHTPMPLNDEAHRNRGSWLVMIALAMLLFAALLSLLYRWMLPTDGWTLDDSSNESILPAVLKQDMLGLPNGLQPGDVVLRVKGIADFTSGNLSGVNSLSHADLWQPGVTMNYDVQRDRSMQTIPVTLGRWNLDGLLSANGGTSLLEWLRVVFQFLIGLYVFARRPGSAGAQVLLFLGVIEVAMTLVLVLPYGVGDLLNPFAVVSVALLGYFSWAVLLFPTILLLSLVFPKPKWSMRTHPIPTLAVLYMAEFALVITRGVSDRIATISGYGIVATFGLLTVASAVHTVFISRKDAVLRAQVAWVGLGLVITAGTVAIMNLIGLLAPGAADAGDAVFALARLALPVTLAVAILRYRLFDIDVVINRALVYGGATMVILIMYIAIVGGVGALLNTQGNPAVAFGAACVVAVIFQPLRGRMQRAINRLMYGQRDEPYAVLARFGRQLEATPALDTLLPAIIATIKDTLKLPFVAIELASDSTTEPSHVRFPLKHQGERIGALIVAPREGERDLSATDHRLLEDLARQAEVAIHAAGVTADLQSSNCEQLQFVQHGSHSEVSDHAYHELQSSGVASAAETIRSDCCGDRVMYECRLPRMAKVS